MKPTNPGEKGERPTVSVGFMTPTSANKRDSYSEDSPHSPEVKAIVLSFKERIAKFKDGLPGTLEDLKHYEGLDYEVCKFDREFRSESGGFSEADKVDTELDLAELKKRFYQIIKDGDYSFLSKGQRKQIDKDLIQLLSLIQELTRRKTLLWPSHSEIDTVVRLLWEKVPVGLIEGEHQELLRRYILVIQGSGSLEQLCMIYDAANNLLKAFDTENELRKIIENSVITVIKIFFGFFVNKKDEYIKREFVAGIQDLDSVRIKLEKFDFINPAKSLLPIQSDSSILEFFNILEGAAKESRLALKNRSLMTRDEQVGARYASELSKNPDNLNFANLAFEAYRAACIIVDHTSIDGLMVHEQSQLIRKRADLRFALSRSRRATGLECEAQMYLIGAVNILTTDPEQDMELIEKLDLLLTELDSFGHGTGVSAFALRVKKVLEENVVDINPKEVSDLIQKELSRVTRLMQIQSPSGSQNRASWLGWAKTIFLPWVPTFIRNLLSLDETWLPAQVLLSYQDHKYEKFMMFLQKYPVLKISQPQKDGAFIVENFQTVEAVRAVYEAFKKVLGDEISRIVYLLFAYADVLSRDDPKIFITSEGNTPLHRLMTSECLFGVIILEIDNFEKSYLRGTWEKNAVQSGTVEHYLEKIRVVSRINRILSLMLTGNIHLIEQAKKSFLSLYEEMRKSYFNFSGSVREKFIALHDLMQAHGVIPEEDPLQADNELEEILRDVSLENLYSHDIFFFDQPVLVLNDSSGALEKIEEPNTLQLVRTMEYSKFVSNLHRFLPCLTAGAVNPPATVFSETDFLLNAQDINVDDLTRIFPLGITFCKIKKRESSAIQTVCLEHAMISKMHPVAVIYMLRNSMFSIDRVMVPYRDDFLLSLNISLSGLASYSLMRAVVLSDRAAHYLSLAKHLANFDYTVSKNLWESAFADYIEVLKLNPLSYNACWGVCEYFLATHQYKNIDRFLKSRSQDRFFTKQPQYFYFSAISARKQNYLSLALSSIEKAGSVLAEGGRTSDERVSAERKLIQDLSNKRIKKSFNEHTEASKTLTVDENFLYSGRALRDMQVVLHLSIVGRVDGFIAAILLAEIEGRTKRPVSHLCKYITGSSPLVCGLLLPSIENGVLSKYKPRYTAVELVKKYEDNSYEKILEEYRACSSDDLLAKNISDNSEVSVLAKLHGPADFSHQLFRRNSLTLFWSMGGKEVAQPEKFVRSNLSEGFYYNISFFPGFQNTRGEVPDFQSEHVNYLAEEVLQEAGGALTGLTQKLEEYSSKVVSFKK